MKFKAKLIDIACVHQFIKILTAVGKITKTCALRLTPTQLILTMTDKVISGGTSLWCELNQADFFSEWRIEGKDENNEIYLEVINENLVRAMRSGQNAQVIKIRLTKKSAPCLSFEVTQPSLSGAQRTMTHDVFVAVIPSRFWEAHQRPLLPDYQMRVALPSLRTVKSIIERMKNLSGYITITATFDGLVTLEVHTEDVTATTYFKNLTVEPSASQLTDGHASARVDVNRLLSFLQAAQLGATQVVCGIVDGMAAHMFVTSDDYKLQYFLPAINV